MVRAVLALAAACTPGRRPTLYATAVRCHAPRHLLHLLAPDARRAVRCPLRVGTRGRSGHHAARPLAAPRLAWRGWRALRPVHGARVVVAPRDARHLAESDRGPHPERSDAASPPTCAPDQDTRAEPRDVHRSARASRAGATT